MTEGNPKQESQINISSATEQNEVQEKRENKPNVLKWESPIAKIKKIKDDCLKFFGDMMKSDQKTGTESEEGPISNSENRTLPLQNDLGTLGVREVSGEEYGGATSVSEQEFGDNGESNVISKFDDNNVDDNDPTKSQPAVNIGATNVKINMKDDNAPISLENNNIISITTEKEGEIRSHAKEGESCDVIFTDDNEINKDEEDARSDIIKVENSKANLNEVNSTLKDVNGDPKASQETFVSEKDTDIELKEKGSALCLENRKEVDKGSMFDGSLGPVNEKTSNAENLINANQENNKEIVAAHANGCIVESNDGTAKEINATKDVMFSQHRSLLLEILLKYFGEKVNENVERNGSIENKEQETGNSIMDEVYTDKTKDSAGEDNIFNEIVQTQNSFQKRVPYKQKKPEYFEMAKKRAMNNNLASQANELTAVDDFSKNEGNEPISKDVSISEESEEKREELNIIILGQSGVGKSTWINSIINYLNYNDLDEAEKNGVICGIPTSFVITSTPLEGEDFIKHVIQVGDKDPNELTFSGKSGTKEPRTYTFNLGKKLVRLIDTPGLGDTEGIEKDNENLNMIINHISSLKEIHGICILLKSNETRLGALFKFCISELLSSLHRSSAKNIIFCFTNSRSSFYAPGDTISVLEDYLSELNLTDLISFSKEMMFCLDNEAFRYLCILKNENKFQIEDREEYNRSWMKSVAETKRFFKEVQKLVPHSIMDTVNLCNTSFKLNSLLEPVAETCIELQKDLVCVGDETFKISQPEIEENFKTKQRELDTLLTSCAIFHLYLKKNHLLKNRDRFKEYLKELIRKDRKMQLNDNPCHPSIKLLERYEEKIKEFEMLKKEENISSNLTLTGIDNLVKTIFSLELTGKKIQEKTKLKMELDRKIKLKAEIKLPIDVVSI